MAEGARRLVLITRAEPDATETAHRVAALGWEPVVSPVLSLVQGRIRTQVRFDAILVASRNALAALPDWYRDVKLLAVGSATARRATELGFTQVLDADGDAAALAGLARASLSVGSRVLVVHARGQGDALVASVEAGGFRVARRQGYAMRPVPRMPPAGLEALRSGRLAAATFLSAETARAFVRCVPAALAAGLAEVDALAIGQAAADALAPLPWRRVRVSLRPTLDGVLALL